MTSKNNTVETIRDQLHKADNILITSHIRPDGDAVGSLLGLGLALMAIGKDVQMVLADGLPATFKHLSGADLVGNEIEEGFDLAIAVDCSDMERLGGVLGGYQPDINIDHHITNRQFAHLNLVEDKAATAAIIADHLIDWDLPITTPAVEALLTGIVTDTIGFSTSNMSGDVLRTAANLVDHGADIHILYNKALNLRSYSETKLWGLGLSRMQRKGRVVWTSISKEDKKQSHFNGKGSADIVNLLAEVKDADIAIVFLEETSHQVKVSWRAKQPYDISNLAVSFGGGGHPAAAGAEIPGSLEEVKQNILTATFDYLNKGTPPKN